MTSVAISRSDEKGYLLWETAAALPVLVFLLSVLGYVTLWSFRAYQREMADLNAQEELHLAMERIVEDAKNAESVEITANEQRVYKVSVVMHAEPEQKVNNAKLRTRADYDVRRVMYGSGASIHRRLTGDNGEPLTGDSYVSGETDVTEFVWEQRRDNMLRITLALRSVPTGHEYKFSTEIYLSPRVKVKRL